jgi:CHAT domain-containing protein
MALVAEQRALDPDLQMIPGVGEEVDVVESTAKLHDVKIIHRQSEASSVELTSAVLQRANIVHLACHGVQDAVSATQSGFCLGDGRLTIAKIMELKLDGAFLAFLSACETAKGDMNQPDQAMHLAAAMLFSGFNSVIATMWYVAVD